MIFIQGLALCAGFVLSHGVDHKITQYDLNTIERAAARCKTLYSTDHCLARFVITAPMTYHAVCKKENS